MEATMSTVAILDKTAQKTNIWLHDAVHELDWVTMQRAYMALRAVLHALRDQLSVEEVAQLGAQLPIFIRGVYYEGWNPAQKSLKNRKKEVFLAHVRKEFAHTRNPDVDAEHIVRSIIRVLCKHITGGEMDQVKHVLPHELRDFWPKADAA
jgi:uncharacterized protein (DUF2267 family)